MKKGIYLLSFLVAIQAIAFEKNIEKFDKSLMEQNWSTFKSNFGYQIDFPSCMIAMPNNADDYDKKSETLDDIIIKGAFPSCQFVHKGVGLAITRYKPSENKIPYHERIGRIRNMININKSAGDNSWIYYKQTEEFNFLEISLLSSFKEVNWNYYIPCGDDLFRIGISTEYNKIPDPKIAEAIKKGDPSIPEVENKMIKSFKCTKKSKK